MGEGNAPVSGKPLPSHQCLHLARVQLKQLAVIQLKKLAVIQLQHLAVLKLEHLTILQLRELTALHLEELAGVQQLDYAILHLQHLAALDLEQRTVLHLQHLAAVQLQNLTTLQLRKLAAGQLEYLALLHLNGVAVLRRFCARLHRHGRSARSDRGVRWLVGTINLALTDCALSIAARRRRIDAERIDQTSRDDYRNAPEEYEPFCVHVSFPPRSDSLRRSESVVAAQCR